MMGVPVDGVAHIYGDIMFVIANKQLPVLQKKNNTICYHTLHEFEAMGKSLTTHVDGSNNPTD